MSGVIPVVFCFDKRIILGAAVAIKSLIDNADAETIYDIRIFHSDLNLDNQRKIAFLVKNTRHNMTFQYINPDIFKGVPCNRHSWRENVYYRFLVPDILKNYKKAIYSDVDVLFKGDLGQLYNIDISDYQLGAVGSRKYDESYHIKCLNDKVFYSGLILFNCEKFRQEKLFDKLLKNAFLKKENLKFYDLDVMNSTCDKIYPLSLQYCLLQGFLNVSDIKDFEEYDNLSKIYTEKQILQAFKQPYIIHYAGKPGKPWRMKKPYRDYEDTIKSLPKNLVKYTFRDIRKKLLNKV